MATFSTPQFPPFREASASPPINPITTTKPTVIGLFGVPGSGKTFLMRQLKARLGEDRFRFYEGSEVIDRIVPGGLRAFEALSDQRAMDNWRRRAIGYIARDLAASPDLVGVVTGHFSFWFEHREFPEVVCTEDDIRVYTHIFYLDVAPGVVAQRCADDPSRTRAPVSEDHVRRWQMDEKMLLRSLCRQSGILYHLVDPAPSAFDRVFPLLRDIGEHPDEANVAAVQDRLDEILHGMGRNKKLETMLVLDGDGTLCAADTGTMFWERVRERRNESVENACPLTALFGGPMGYTLKAFRQAALLYEETRREFDEVCDEVACASQIHTEFVALLRAVEEVGHVGAVVVTCGLGRVWEMILDREGLSKSVKVIGGGRVSDGYVVDPEAKAAVVARLRGHHNLRVWAFGDSPMDLPMLKAADHAIVVVVGEEESRSRSMDAALEEAIDSDGLAALQALIPSSATPRLDTVKLPPVDIISQEFMDVVAVHRQHLKVFHATEKKAAKLLMTPMRDASVSGPSLRAAHHRVGWYLAVEYASEILGLEEYPIRHVQGHETKGHRLRKESKTVVVALMRGGEPMALGVGEVFHRAMFLHANGIQDLKKENLTGRKTVLLVDSVINSGKSIREFVEHVRELDAGIRIVIVAGVVQENAVSDVLEPLGAVADLSLVALRISGNKFTGSGGTDTGNRLFNTTHLK